MKAEPKSILLFLYSHFDLVRDLFDFQLNEGLIRKESLNAVLEKYGKDVRQQLFDYQVVKKSGDDYELREAYYGLLEFILVEFRPLLPEEVAKFGNAISELFRKINEGIAGDKNILLERIKALSAQIREFAESVERNSIRLLNETRELKSNVARIDYQHKIQKASFWIEYYVAPLNTILDVNHSESITNKLLDISVYSNQKLLSIEDESTRMAFQQLYFMLRQTNDDLLIQSKILTNDLLPLIERIRTESIILTGWIEFLKQPYKVKPPKLLTTFAQRPYSDKMVFNAREYAEQFLITTETFLDGESEASERWIFHKAKFKERLIEELPVDNYFQWCCNQLSGDAVEISNDKVFAMTSLLFEEDVDVEFAEHDEMIAITTKTSVLKVPKIQLNKNGVS